MIDIRKEELKNDFKRLFNNTESIMDRLANLIIYLIILFILFVIYAKNIQNRSTTKGEETKLNSDSVNSNELLLISIEK